jgi:hypothetical protein
MRLRTTVFPLAGVYLASSRVTSPTRCRLVKAETAGRTGSYPMPASPHHGSWVTFLSDQGAPRGSAAKEERTEWARIPAYITGTADQELLLRNKYLVATDWILKTQWQGRAILPISMPMVATDGFVLRGIAALLILRSPLWQFTPGARGARPDHPISRHSVGRRIASLRREIASRS